MLIGIVSDTHDHLSRLRQALALCRERGAEIILHAGDFVSPFTAEEFRKADLPVIGVFGNNDGDKLYLRERFSGVGDLHPGPHEMELAGRRIVLMHEPRALEALVASRRYDLVVYGHTHQIALQRGQPLVINPGECSGWLSGRATCAVVDLSTWAAEILDLG